MATSHLKSHAINESADHAPGTNGTLLGTESNALAEKSFGTAATASLIVQRGASGQVTLPAADPVNPSDATSKAYVDEQVVSGVTWKELVLHPDQAVDGGTGAGGVAQAILCDIEVNPADTNTFSIYDGATQEDYTFKTTPVGGNDVQIGGSAAVTLTNLVAVINANSALWDAVETAGLDAYFAASPASQFVVRRTVPIATATADRVFGTQAAQSNIRVVEFATGDQDYRMQSGTESDLPVADPAAKRFGFGRLFAALNGGDTHRVANDNTAYSWDSDDEVWQQTGSGTTVTEGDGIDVTGSKVSTDVATATAERQYGGLTNRSLSDGSALGAGADAGYNAVQTDNSDLAINASNQVAIKAASRLDKIQGVGTWASTGAAVKEPVLSELNNALGTAAGDIGNWCFMVEDGTAVGSTSTFIAYKKANAGALADYQLVELS